MAIAVPANTIFGVACAMALVRRPPKRGTWLINSMIGLPLALSPVVVGLALILVYGQDGWFGGWLTENGIEIIFSTPGIVLATIFVTLPFVVREVIPVLREVGTDQDEAAWTLGASRFQTFWRVTLPAIRWGVAYGVVLTTARALGEYGAVAVVSGRIAGKTETLTLHVDEEYLRFDEVAAYTTSLVLALLAVLTLIAMNIFKPRNTRRSRMSIAVRQVTKRFDNGFVAVDNVSLAIAERVADRAARAERKRQVDPPPRDRRPREARRRAMSRSSARTSPASRPRSAASASSSSTTRPSST